MRGRINHIIPLITLLALAAVWPADAQFVDDRPAPSASFDTTVVAVIDGAPVHFGEVQRSFRLRPVWERGQQHVDAYQRQLEQVIDERLLAMEARNVRLDLNDAVAHHLAFIEDREINRELYREVVLDRIDVGPERLERAYELGKRRIIVTYIRTTDPSRAERYRMALASGDDSLAVHPEDDRGETDWLRATDLHESLSELFFGKEGDVLGPLLIDGRHTVVRLERGEVDVFMSEWDLAQQKSRLVRLLQEREAAPLAAQYVADLMADKHVRLDQDGFAALARHLNEWLVPGTPELRLDEERIAAVQDELPLYGDEVVVRFAGGEMSALDVMRGLSSMPSSLIRPGRPIHPQLRDAIAVLVRNHFIALEGRARGLHERPAVRREVAYFQNQYLAGQLRVLARRGVEVSPARLSEMRASAADAPGDELSDEQLADLIRSYELARWETGLVQRLRHRHNVQVDPETLASIINYPSARIDHDPVPLIVRDIFH